MATTIEEPRTDASPPPPGGGLRAGRRARLADPAFKWAMALCGAAVLLVLAWMIGATTSDAWPVFRKEGLNFFFGTTWQPGTSRTEVTGTYQVGVLLFGTVITSVMAILLAVPLAVGIALYLTQLAPARVKRPLTYAVDMLAAVPSVVYGLWGALFLVPLLSGFMTWLAGVINTVIPFIGEPVRVRNVWIASLVLAIMILPIISAVTREVIATVPPDERYAAYGLGATRWEVMRHVILPRARPGIIGATMLGLGRALGETIAVLLLIGNQGRIGLNVFDTNNTIAAEIASAWKEAAPEHQLGLIAAGVALFLLTILVNMAARVVVARTGGVGGGANL